MNLSCFERLLRTPPDREDVYNPWWSRDPQHDLADCDTASIRRRHLRAYLKHRDGHARFLLLAEALGYQGGHFSGIPMTSERLLLGHQAIDPAIIFPAPNARRTSRPELKPKGFVEPTGTIVWRALADSGCDPREFVLWNAYPWHPYHKGKGLLSNRPPTLEELQAGEVVLRELIDQLGAVRILAVGRNAERILQSVGLESGVARHPANGGARQFRADFTHWLGQNGTLHHPRNEEL